MRARGSLRSTRITNASVAPPRAGSRTRMSVVPGPIARSLAIAATGLPALELRVASPVPPASARPTAAAAPIVTASSTPACPRRRRVQAEAPKREGQQVRGIAVVVVSRGRFGEAFDLVMEGEESLSGEVEAVVCFQRAFGDVDEDAFLEIEQLENGKGVSLAVDGAQVVARKFELRSRRQLEVVLAGVLGKEGGCEVGVGDRETDAHIAAVLVPEARVDADVDGLARVRERPDPATDVDLLAAFQGDRVDRADHPPLGLLDVGRNGGLP